MAKYFYTSEGKTLGPASPKEVMALILDDVLDMDSFVMDSRSPQWLKIREIPELMRYLHESEVQISDWGEEKAMAGIEDQQQELFFHLPVSRLVWLSLLTFGLYEVYWLYANWRFLRFNRKRRTATYFWKDSLNPFALVGVFHQISMDEELGGRSSDRDFTLNGWLWIFSLLALAARSILVFALALNVLVDIGIALAALTLSILCLIPVQKHINAGNAQAGKGFSKPTFGHYATIVIGILGLAMVLGTWIPRLIGLLS